MIQCGRVYIHIGVDATAQLLHALDAQLSYAFSFIIDQ
jgi:hypothetical protein